MTYFLLFLILKFAIAYHNASSQLIEKAVDVTSQYYNHQFATSVVWSDNDSDGVTNFLMKFPGSVVITPLLKYNNIMILDAIQHFGYSQTIFFATGPNEFEIFMNLLSANLRFPIRLVLVLRKSLSEASALSTFMEIAWQNNLADIVIIYENQSNQIFLSTYFPHSNGVCENYIPVTLKPSENMFPEKFKNFNRCSIRVSVMHYEPLVGLYVENGTVSRLTGYYAIILMLVMNTLNATSDVFKLSTYGDSSNDTVTGGFSDLVNNKTDILLPAGVLSHGRYLVTQRSQAYYSENRWIGPKRRVIYSWTKLLIPFLNRATAFLCLAFTSLVFIAILIKKCKLPKKGGLDSLCFRVFSLLVGQTVTSVIKVPLLNNILLLWIWFGFFIRIKYQGDLVESLQNEILEPPLGSLEEAVTKVEGFGGFQIFSHYYKDTILEHDYIIIEPKDYEYYLNGIVEGKRFLLSTGFIEIQHVRHSIQILDEPISTSTSCLFMRPGWPASGAVNSVVVTMLETGIIQKIYSMNDDTRRDKTYKKAYRLNMSMVSSCFYAMGFMWLVCSIIFLLEIIYSKYRYEKEILVEGGRSYRL